MATKPAAPHATSPVRSNGWGVGVTREPYGMRGAVGLFSRSTTRVSTCCARGREKGTLARDPAPGQSTTITLYPAAARRASGHMMWRGAEAPARNTSVPRSALCVPATS